MVAFLVLLYLVYAGSLLLDGIGLATGLFPGGGSFAITFVPAIVAAVLIGAVGAMALLPGDIERRLQGWASGSGRLAQLGGTGGDGPGAGGERRAHGDRADRRARSGLLGALAWWGFDICVLWAMFHAFGSPPPFTVIGWPTSSACSATCCRCPAASEASRAA